MGVFNTGVFSKPKFSAFPWRHSNKVSMKAGVLKPVAVEYLNTGERITDVDMSGIIRNAPMVAPTLDTYRCDLHAFAVRLRSIGNANRDPWVYEDFFNLKKNTDGSRRLPSVPLGAIFAANGLALGTLFESLGLPSFKADREQYLDFIRSKFPYVLDPVMKLAYIPQSAFTTGAGMGTLLVGYPASLAANVTFAPVDNEDVYPQGPSKYPVIDYDMLCTVYGPGSDYSDSNAVGFYFTGHSDKRFTHSFLNYFDDYLYLPFWEALVPWAVRNYPDIAPSPVYASTGQNILGIFTSGFAGVTAYYDPEQPDFSEYDGLNVLDAIYKHYKIDSATVLAQYMQYLLDCFLTLSQHSSDVDSRYKALYYTFKGSSYLDDTGLKTSYEHDSVFEVLRKSLIYSFPSAEVERTKILTTSVGGTDVYDIMVPIYYIQAYWKIISDWYINTSVDEADTYFLARCGSLNLNQQGVDGFDSDTCQKLGIANALFHRLWANDYFTSAFSSPQAGNAVGIPVNGTIVDLRNANAMQKLKERLLYAGSRFRDVLYAISGKRTEAAILEMSEVLASCSMTINVDSVLKQSGTDIDGPQADYAGTGLAYRSGSKSFSYTASEPTVIMIMASIIPEASYFQGLNRRFYRQSVYDYAVPQLANVGEQLVHLGELYVGSDVGIGASGGVDNIKSRFGYQRRNADFMWVPNEVHSDFRDTLDFWHNARIFGSAPSFGRKFLEVNAERDNLNRIFAVSSDAVDHFYCRFDFGGQVIRSLPKHVHYDL